MGERSESPSGRGQSAPLIRNELYKCSLYVCKIKTIRRFWTTGLEVLMFLVLAFKGYTLTQTLFWHKYVPICSCVANVTERAICSPFSLRSIKHTKTFRFSSLLVCSYKKKIKYSFSPCTSGPHRPSQPSLLSSCRELPFKREWRIRYHHLWGLL